MSAKNLYQRIILDHNRSPRNTGILTDADIDVFDRNPVCGDEIRLTLNLAEQQIQDVRFEARGCALSIASASMLTELISGKPLEEAEQLAEKIIAVFKSQLPIETISAYSDLYAMKDVLTFPSRIKCVLMGWQLFIDGLKDQVK